MSPLPVWNGHCLQATHCSNSRIQHLDSPRIEQLFDQWKKRINEYHPQLFMDTKQKVVISKSQKQDQGAVLAWLKSLDVDRLSEYIDQNIRIFRYLPYTVAIAGFAVLLRSIRLATKFTDGTQVPLSFIRHNVQLRGRLVDVDLVEGTLSVEHLPILRLPWHLFYKTKSPPNLQIRLAFTSPTISGIYWMRLNVNGAPIKFRLIDHCKTGEEQKNRVLWAAVKVVQLQHQQQQQQRCSLTKKPTLNETLVRTGLAEVGPFPPNRALLSNREAKLLHRLEVAESKAIQEGLGLWSDSAKTTSGSETAAIIAVAHQLIKSWWHSLRIGLKLALRKWLRRTSA